MTSKSPTPPPAEIDDDPDEELELTDEQIAGARPFAEAFPELLANMLKRNRGRPRSRHPKQQVTLRLSADVLDYYRGTGAGWQRRIDEDLSRNVARTSPEATLPPAQKRKAAKKAG